MCRFCYRFHQCTKRGLNLEKVISFCTDGIPTINLPFGPVWISSIDSKIFQFYIVGVKNKNDDPGDHHWLSDRSVVSNDDMCERWWPLLRSVFPNPKTVDVEGAETNMSSLCRYGHWFPRLPILIGCSQSTCLDFHLCWVRAFTHFW